jgi:hypothetical protein
MVNRIFFEGRDTGAAPHLWTFSHAGESPVYPDSAEQFDSELGVCDRSSVQRLSHGDAFVPEYYEGNYAYPLIVWLAAPDASPDEFERRMTGISPRNCLGLQLPVDSASTTRQLLETVRDGVAELREFWNVHTERIIPAGVGCFGEAALRAVIAKPEWFGGAIALDAAFSHPPALPVRNQALRGKRILLAASNVDVGPQHALARLLNASGMVVALRYRNNGAATLADVNAWLMEGICITA